VLSLRLHDTNTLCGGFFVILPNFAIIFQGIMMAVAMCELYPEAIRHGSDGRLPLIMGTVCGFVLMVGSEYILEEQ
jgi:zinc transporter ZupT